MSEYKDPKYNKDSFTCPFCNVYSQQSWVDLGFIGRSNGFFEQENLKRARCQSCNKISIWYEYKMVYPALLTAPLPVKEMPDSIKDNYLEARDILIRSPRGACALLRLALQELCDELVEGDQNLNGKIAELVRRGLSPQLQKAFDFVRLTGNDAVQGLGELVSEDDPAIAEALFKLINIIIEKMITEPKEMNELYKLIPGSKRDAIQKRDNV